MPFAHHLLQDTTQRNPHTDLREEEWSIKFPRPVLKFYL